MPVHIVYDGDGFYELDTEKRIYLRTFLKLLCPKNRCKIVNICIISEDYYKTLIKFASLLEYLKRTSLRNHIKKYKVFTFHEIKDFKGSQISKEANVIFYWLNPD